MASSEQQKHARRLLGKSAAARDSGRLITVEPSAARRSLMGRLRTMSDTALESPTALVSYAHDDGHASPHQLAVELRLRGIPVTRDIEAFRHGRALRGEMEEAVNTDVVVGHLGPAALESEAVIEQELRPALHAHARHGRPLVILVPHGIGATRDEVDAAIAGRLPYSAQATWAREGESSSDPLDPAFCAQVAGDALRSLYGRARGPGEGRWQIQLVTRGTPRHADGFVDLDVTDAWKPWSPGLPTTLRQRIDAGVGEPHNTSRPRPPPVLLRSDLTTPCGSVGRTWNHPRAGFSACIHSR